MSPLPHRGGGSKPYQVAQCTLQCSYHGDVLTAPVRERCQDCTAMGSGDCQGAPTHRQAVKALSPLDLGVRRMAPGAVLRGAYERTRAVWSRWRTERRTSCIASVQHGVAFVRHEIYGAGCVVMSGSSLTSQKHSLAEGLNVICAESPQDATYLMQRRRAA